MSEWNDETAEWYANKYGEYATNRLAVDALDIPDQSVVVDLGCGAGAALRRVASLGTKGKLIGIDPVPRMIEIARERALSHPHGASIEFRQGSAEELPVDDGSADLVLAFDSFDHWENKSRGMTEIRRVLRPHGQLAITKDGGLPSGAKARRELLDALATAGFKVLREQEIVEDDVSLMLWVCSVAD